GYRHSTPLLMKKGQSDVTLIDLIIRKHPDVEPPARVAFRSGHGKLPRGSSRERAGTIIHDLSFSLTANDFHYTITL
ncbi:hypothetical protein, partial [Brevibacillus sp. SYP-B805]|uniref:hypothetical protein n=1 Tax=Brevibacillus sp. SYP-B805 TaxID=1578199 RepID=UPI0019D185F2